MGQLLQLSLLILSDIHYGSMSEHAEFAQEERPPANLTKGAQPVIETLIERVKESVGAVEAILVPGDLTSTAEPAEFQGCAEAVNRIADRLHVPRSNVFYTFGNHDTNWRISKLAGPDAAGYSDNGYHTVAATMAGCFVENSSMVDPGPLLGTGFADTERLQLFIANTGYFCTHTQEPRHGRLGQDQVAWLRSVLGASNDSGKWRILLLHHHPFAYSYPAHVTDISCVDEGAELLDVIGEYGVDLVCHGHRHHPIHITQMRHNWKAPVTFLCAGSVAVNAVHRSNGQIPNLFHTATLMGRSERGAAVGVLRTFRYSIRDGWVPVTESDVVPMDGTQYFGACASDPEREASASSIVQKALTADGGEYAGLPPFDELPLELKCLKSRELATLFKSAAGNIGAEICGRYPDDAQPLVRRSRR